MGLPIEASLPALLAALEAGPNVVLVAPPGAGKTTLVPPALLHAPWRGNGRILMLEPRRLAARAAACRMAALRGEEVGQTVGFRTRLEAATSAATRIEVVTGGLLVRRMQDDPGLQGVACVIFDEVHERGLDADLALAFCLDLQGGLRPELRLLAMSATADGARLSALLSAPVIEGHGRAYPVEVRHAARDLADPRDLPEAAARAVRSALRDATGDILCFLPGMAEIRRTEAALAGCGAAVLPLHGDLPPAEQARALAPAEGRRVVLATSIAETSLTVPGVRVVVDGGWRRAPRFDATTGLTRLATLRISRAAAEQRAGRAGREAPGLAVRLWTLASHRGLAAYDRPQILEAELSGLALDCAAWGAAPADLPFGDPPQAGALAAAQALLRQLGAMDEAARITEHGRRMVRLGTHPRLAAMLLSAGDPAASALACDIAALLEARDPRPEAGADIAARLAAVMAGRDGTAQIRQSAARFRQRLGTGAAPSGDPGMLLAAAFPDRIAQRRGEPGSFRLSGGGGARLPVTDRLANAPLLAVGALELKASAAIRMAAPLDPDNLPETVAAQVTEALEHGFDPASGGVFSRRRRRFGALVLEDRMVPAAPEAAAATLADVLGRDLARLRWTGPARQLQARAARMRGFDPAFADFSDAALAASVQDWLAPHLLGARRLADVQTLDLTGVLRDVLGYGSLARLDQEMPPELELPGGRAPIDYTQPVPVVAARAQTFYGLTETPLLVGGRLKLQLALLSPAGRPIAVTSDIARFWAGGWVDARRDMRGRYPKHDWPENPASAARK